MENNPQEEKELEVQEDSNKVCNFKEEEANEVRPSLRKEYLKILIELVLSSLVYLIASSCNKFRGLNEALDVQHMKIFDYTYYVMIISYILTFIGIIIFILDLYKVNLNSIKKVINLNTLYNVLDWLVIIPICIAIATFCFSFLFTLTNVSGESMEPNIDNQDRLLVLYPSQYERFDVVVIKVDEDYHMVFGPDLYLKRIIGMPGDYIDYRLENKITQLYVNGEKVLEYFYSEDEAKTYLTFNTASDHEAFNWAEKCFTGSDISREQCEDVDGHYIIPDGYYFVLGDNRVGSKDSRNIGLVKEEDIIGVAKYIVNNIFSPEKIY